METNTKLQLQIVLLLLATASIFGIATLPVGLSIKVKLYIIDDYGKQLSLDYTPLDTVTDMSESNYPNTVLFYLYTKERRNDSLLLPIGDVESLKLGQFEPKKRTIIITHGWMNTYESPACTYIRDTYFQQGDYNIILIDWGALSQNDLKTVSSRVPKIAKYVAKMIDFLVSQGMDVSSTIIIGHSLGAHIAGLASHFAKVTLGIVVGLDPAGPYFHQSGIDKRLSKEHGHCVHVIHATNIVGLMDEVGHVDFYPNGGKDQAGCLIPQTCGHERSYEYFAESILNNTFLAHKCETYDKYTLGLCKSHTTALMGGGIPSCNSTGSHMLVTNTKPPFAKN